MGRALGMIQHLRTIGISKDDVKSPQGYKDDVFDGDWCGQEFTLNESGIQKLIKADVPSLVLDVLAGREKERVPASRQALR